MLNYHRRCNFHAARIWIGARDMDSLWLIARLVLAAVFAVAAIGKMRDLDGSIAAVRGFGVPSRFARPIGLALPFVELLAAALLIPVTTALLGAIIAVALLIVFLGGIVNSLRKGETPDCHCFGQFHSEPVGPPTVARNAGLLAIGVFILFGGTTPGHSLTGWLGDETGAVQALVVTMALVIVAVAGLAWLIAHLLGQNGRLLLQIDELRAAVNALPRAPGSAPIAKPAPEFSAPGLAGDRVTLNGLRSAAKPVLLVFSSPKCGPCKTLLPEVASWQKEHAEKLTVALITRGKIDDALTSLKSQGLTRVAVEEDREISKLYEVTGTPSAVLVDRDGRIQSGPVAGTDAIRQLVKTALATPVSNGARPVQPPRISQGEPAPSFALPDTAGVETSVEDLRGSDAMLIFWNPGCGFCKRLQPELDAWAAQANGDRPQLIAVKSGSPAAEGDMQFASKVLVEPSFSTGRLFGASGTPSAVMIDAEGNVSSDLVVGGPAIMELLGKSLTGATARS
jgi:thiol-disulfide isomerase/thioredoxin